MVVDGAASAAGQLAPDAGEALLVAALRAGDESAFRDLVKRYHAALVRLARISATSQAVAEEVVHGTWLAVIKGIGGFEDRSPVKTWIFRILLNQARERGLTEHRFVTVPPVGEDDGPAVDPGRFVPDGQRWSGHWCAPPVPWTDLPAEHLISREMVAVVVRSIAELPEGQREVVTLRDVDGWTAAEVCELLGLSEGSQRVLLHRGRSRVRASVEDHLGGKG